MSRLYLTNLHCKFIFINMHTTTSWHILYQKFSKMDDILLKQQSFPEKGENLHFRIITR